MKKNLKFYLKDKLSEKELELMPTSFDVVGDILIFSDFPKELSKKEKIIGNTILETYHHIKTILTLHLRPNFFMFLHGDIYVFKKFGRESLLAIIHKHFFPIRQMINQIPTDIIVTKNWSL